VSDEKRFNPALWLTVVVVAALLGYRLTFGVACR